MLGTIGRSFPSTHAPVVGVRNNYDAASMRPRLSGWYAPTLGANDSTLGSLGTLRARSRESLRNSAFAKRVLRILVSEMLGTGIAPRSTAPDEEYRGLVDALWKRSVPEMDADGVLDAYGQQHQVAWCWFAAGETFARDRPRLPGDGLAVPYQVQVIEPELCPLEHTTTALNGNRIRAGIEFGTTNMPLAFYLYRQRPGNPQDLDTSQLVRVPADTVRHVYIPERGGQLRGVPHLTQALVTGRDLSGLKDARLLRDRIANLFVGWTENATGTTDAAGAHLDPVTGQPFNRGTDDAPWVKLEAGSFWEPPPGQTIKFNDPPAGGADFEAVARHYNREYAAGGDVPYHQLTGDLSQVNDRTIRVIVQEFRRYLEQLQWFFFIPQFCQPTRNAWFMAAVRSEALPTPKGFWDDPASWMAVEWSPEAWPYINPLQDVETDIKRVRGGFASRRQIIRERGYDPDVVDRERTEELVAADADGRIDDSDPRRTDGGGKAVVATTQNDLGTNDGGQPDAAPR